MQQTITLDYLEQHVYEHHSRGFKAICPECGKHNLYYTQDNGRCYCFNCQTSYRLADHTSTVREGKPKDIPAIRAYYKELAWFYHGCIEQNTRRYLNNRGIDDTAIQDFRLGYCPDNAIGLYKHPIAIDAGIATRQGNPSLADRIVMPYLVDDDVTDMRGRAIRTDQDPKYKSLFGSSEARGASIPFNWDRAIRKAHEQKYLIITEGEIKALVADEHGFPCVAMPGMATWRRGCTPAADWRVVVIFDRARDPKAQLQIDHAIARVHDRLPTIYVGTLTLLDEDKQDLDSFLLHVRGGARRLKQIVDDALTYQEYRRIRTF